MRSATILLAGAFLVAALASCGDDAVGEAPCGEGLLATYEGGTACVFERPKVVIETGFRCPVTTPFRHDFGDAVICAEDQELPEVVLEEITEDFLPWPDPVSPGETVPPVDILWVIDDSQSMTEEQFSLAEHAAAVMAAVSDLGSDFRMAVVSTDALAQDGAFRTAPGGFLPELSEDESPDCPEATGPVLVGQDYRIDPENPEAGIDLMQLQQDFACLCMVGTGGSGFEQGLESMRRALSLDRLQTTNSGFRRSDAWLVVIFVTDENDCSGDDVDLFMSGSDCEWRRDDLTPVQEYVDFLNELEGTNGGERIVVGGIVGPDDGERYDLPNTPEPSCVWESEYAFAGYRYAELIASFGNRGVLGSICGGDLEDVIDVLRVNLLGHLAGAAR